MAFVLPIKFQISLTLSIDFNFQYSPMKRVDVAHSALVDILGLYAVNANEISHI